MVSPVTPQPPEQAFHALSGRETAQGHGDSAPEYGGRKTEPAQQAGKISPVMPPLPQQAKQGTDAHAAQPASRSTAARVMPANPSTPSGRIPPTGKGAVPSQVAAPADNVPRESRVHGTASVTVAPARATNVPPPGQERTDAPVSAPARQQPASAPPQMTVGIIPAVNAPSAPPAVSGGMAQAHRMDKAVSTARIAPAQESAPRSVAPRLGSAVTPEQQGIPTVQQIATHGATHGQGLPAVQPAIQTKGPSESEAAFRSVPTDCAGRPPVYPAGQQTKAGGRDTASHPDVTPGVRTPDMVTPPPAVQPRTLRRSAQPLKSKAAPETPKGGGTHNRKRRRKK